MHESSPNSVFKCHFELEPSIPILLSGPTALPLFSSTPVYPWLGTRLSSTHEPTATCTRPRSRQAQLQPPPKVVKWPSTNHSWAAFASARWPSRLSEHSGPPLGSSSTTLQRIKSRSGYASARTRLYRRFAAAVQTGNYAWIA